MAQPDYQVWLLSGVAYEVSFSGSHQLQPGDHVRFVLSADQGCANALTPPEGTLNGGVLDGAASVTLQLPGGVDGTYSGLYALCVAAGGSTPFAYHPHVTARVTHEPPSQPPPPLAPPPSPPPPFATPLVSPPPWRIPSSLPAAPPPFPPLLPRTALVRRVRFHVTLGGTIEAFDQQAYVLRLASTLGIEPARITLVVAAASVSVTAIISSPTDVEAAAVAKAVDNLAVDTVVASAALKVSVISAEPASTQVVVRPVPSPPPAVLTLPPPSSPLDALGSDGVLEAQADFPVMVLAAAAGGCSAAVFAVQVGRRRRVSLGLLVTTSIASMPKVARLEVARLEKLTLQARAAWRPSTWPGAARRCCPRSPTTWCTSPSVGNKAPQRGGVG